MRDNTTQLVAKAGIWFTVLMGFGGLIWALAVANQKLELSCRKGEVTQLTVDLHNEKIVILETKVDFIVEGIKQINRKLDKTDNP